MDHIKFAFEEIKKNPVPWIVLNLIFMFVPLVNLLFAVQFCRVVRDSVENNRAPEIGDLFKTDKMGTDVTTVLIMFGCIFASALLCYLPVFFVGPVLAMTLWITADDKLSGMDAIKASWYWGKENWLHCFGTLFVIVLICQLTIYACGLGLLVFASLMHLAHYSWYRASREAIYAKAQENGLNIA